MIKTEHYVYDEENGQLVAKTGYNLFVALNELFDFKIDLLKSYSAKTYKAVNDGAEFSGDFEDLLNWLNASKKVVVNVAKSHQNQVPKHVVFIKKVEIVPEVKEQTKKKAAKVVKDAE